MTGVQSKGIRFLLRYTGHSIAPRLFQTSGIKAGRLPYRRLRPDISPDKSRSSGALRTQTPNPDRTGTRHYRAACLFGCAAHGFSADQWVWYNRFRKLCTERGRLLQRRGKTLGAVDLYAASRLQQRRIELGISQRKLAATLGLTFQQIHKYEQGKSRISAGRLYELGKVLGVPITFFIEGVADALTPAAPLAIDDHADELGRREAIELFTAYRAISDPVLRRSLRDLARALGSETNGSAAESSVGQNRRASRRART